jgi:O-antigen ligase
VAVPFAVALLWGWLQSMSVLPTAWAHPLWAEAADALGPDMAAPAGRLSLDPAMSRTALMRLLCYGAIFWLAAQLCRERSRAHEAVVGLAVAGIAYAAYGLLEYLSGTETILWLDKLDYRGDLTATFINRNAYGAYAGIGLLCCLALFVNGLRHVWKSVGGLRDHAETIILRSLPFLAGATLIGTALMLSHSRGAFLCTGAGIFVLLGCLAVAKVIPPAKVAAVALAVLVVIGAIVLINGDLTVSRFGNSSESDDERIAIYRLVSAAIGDAPWTGFGIGAFMAAFRLYADTSLPLPLAVNMAHNVHLELGMDLGLAAAACLYLSFAVLTALALAALVRRRRDHVYPALGLAVTALLGLHGTVDFSVQMPAIAATYAFVLGIAFAQSFNTSERKRQS